MKRLSRIIMVNWYLFEANEWDIKGHAALIGKNGSGKSSFIDAIQLVMLGGHKQDWHPNAKASDTRRTRDIRSYVLGLIKDESALSDNALYQPRESALCRIVLVFEDEQTGGHVSVGAAISARRSDPKEQVEGFFILKDKALRLSDVTRPADGGLQPKAYADMKSAFRHELEDGQVYLFAHEPANFVEQMLRTLGGRSRPPSSAKYRRAFKQSISLGGLDGSVSDFVKYSILETKPLQLENMRQSMESYHNKKQAVERAEQQIKELDRISGHFKRALQASERRAGYAWCAEELRFLAHDIKQASVYDDLCKLVSQYSSLKQKKFELHAQRISIQEELDSVTSAINSDTSEITRQRLEEKRKNAEREVDLIERQLKELKQQLELCSEGMRYQERLGDTLTGYFDDIARTIQATPLHWPVNPEEVDHIVAALKELLPQAEHDLDNRKASIKGESDQQKLQLKDIQARLDRLNKGGADLSAPTQTLIEALADAGIKAKPVCECVEVGDAKWQPAIEAFLRQNVEALVVAPAQAREAVELYRRMKKQISYGAVVINTEKVREWKDNVKPGTAAALITGDDPLAVIYIQRLLLNIQLTDETTEFMKQDRALTPDGMFIRQAGIQRLKLPELPKLGRGAREKQIQVLNARADQLAQDLGRLNGDYQQVEGAYKIVNRLHHGIEKMPAVSRLVSARVGYQREANELSEQIEAISTQHLDELKRKQDKLKLDRERTGNQYDKCVQAKGSTVATFRQQRRRFIELKQEMSVLSETRKQKTADVDFVQERASELLEQLEQEIQDDNYESYEKAVHIAEERMRTNTGTQHNEETRGRELLSQYSVTYQSDTGFMEPHSMAGYRALVDDLLYQIRDIGLAERKQDVIDAMRRVQQVIRQDVAIRLRSHVDQMKERLNELNKELSARPFSSNQIYQFRHDKLPEFREFLHYVESVTEVSAANAYGLFDQDADQDKFIAQILDSERGDELADYRNYYKFDIEIKDPEANLTELLSRRMGAASGGEHKTPYYVAMGAALASAYRIERRADSSLDGGLALYLADEAFEKMDHVNSVQASNYLKSIGLQLFIAAPDDTEAKLRQMVDTVLYFMRENDVAEVEVDYIQPAAKKLLASMTQGYSRLEEAGGV
ncbi:MAG: hypothetical protein L0Z73_06405 [Gammaproteobacteria bacterium]|nr:hypothetical protein [Gammaproteobacteria bacterium]